MSNRLNADAALDELESSESPLRANEASESAPGATPEITTLRGLRGYRVQVEYLEERISQDFATPRLWLVDNLEMSVAPNSNEISQLIGLVWQQKARLHGARVAWVSTSPCALGANLLLTLPITLRRFKTIKSARAWLREGSK